MFEVDGKWFVYVLGEDQVARRRQIEIRFEIDLLQEQGPL